MYISKGSGMTVYENLDELLSADINFISEYEGFYYVKLKPYCYYDNSIWKVDKKTKEVSYMMFTRYILDVMDEAKEIDLETLKRGA